LDGMYDVTCPKYAQAFLKFQCDLDPLFDVTCGGYAVAKAELDAKAMAEKQKYEEEQKILEEQARAAEEANKVIEQVYEEEPVYKEEAKTIFSEDPVDELMTEEEVFLEEIEKIIEEAAPVEEKIEEKVVVEEIVEEEVVEEPVIVEIVEEDVASEKKLIDIDRVLDVMSDQAQKSQKMLSDSAEMSVTSQDDPTFGTSSRSERYNALSDALKSEERDDSVARDVVASPTTTLQAQSEGVSEEILDDGGSTETMDATFGDQMTQAFATGGNIGTFLSGEQPNFTRFDIKPPSKDEQRDTKKVESLAEKMSDQAIEENIDKLKEGMQNSGGFDGNQAVTVTLMGHVPNFNQYRSTDLQDQQQWYSGETVYDEQKNVDNTYNLYKMVGGGDAKHKEMVLEQYGR